jgi:asparagine synthase (glutamine-hydrolysing)
LCGIAGIVGMPAGVSADTLAKTWLRVLRHRGPDDFGWLVLSGRQIHRGRADCPAIETDALLLQRRLSILDLSEAGWQPMATPEGRFFITYNGEIYNYLELQKELQALGHTFLSHSDTEVLLHAYIEWGAQALTRLIGMFAFAVLDVRNRSLFLARDCFGIKPLYYTQSPTTFAFASEIKALLELPGVKRRANPQRLFEYLRWGRTDHGGETMYAGIHQLPAAHCIEITLDKPGSGSPVRYWQVNLGKPLDVSERQAATQVRELFLHNVRLHLRSDVPVGTALSGGIDSSAIVGAMRHLAPRAEIHAISYVANDPALSEEHWIDLAGKSAQATVHKVHATPEEMVADLDFLISQQDEPFGSTSIYAQHRVFKRAQEAGIKVMLDGQGADEMLAGYRPFLAARFASLLRQSKWEEASRFLVRSSRQQGAGGMPRVLLQAAHLLCPERFRTTGMRLFGKNPLPPWLNGHWFQDHGVKVGSPHAESCTKTKQLLREQLLESLMESSLPMLLRFEDRNSMAYSIESRVPFLTPAFVDFVLQLPEHCLIAPDGTSKSVFRQAMRGLVPDAILDRRDKIGFATPEQHWLATLRPWVDQTLSSEAAQQIPALDLAAMKKEWLAVVEQRRPFDFRIWRWVNLIRWSERLGVNF